MTGKKRVSSLKSVYPITLIMFIQGPLQYWGWTHPSAKASTESHRDFQLSVCPPPKNETIWRFPKSWGYPQSWYPHLIFGSILNHPAIKGIPHDYGNPSRSSSLLAPPSSRTMFMNWKASLDRFTSESTMQKWGDFAETLGKDHQRLCWKLSDLTQIRKSNKKAVGGIPTPLKNMKVSWHDEIPNWMETYKNVPNHQRNLL